MLHSGVGTGWYLIPYLPPPTGMASVFSCFRVIFKRKRGQESHWSWIWENKTTSTKQDCAILVPFRGPFSQFRHVYMGVPPAPRAVKYAADTVNPWIPGAYFKSKIKREALARGALIWGGRSDFSRIYGIGGQVYKMVCKIIHFGLNSNQNKSRICRTARNTYIPTIPRCEKDVKKIVIRMTAD